LALSTATYRELSEVGVPIAPRNAAADLPRTPARTVLDRKLESNGFVLRDFTNPRFGAVTAASAWRGDRYVLRRKRPPKRFLKGVI
jgi:hypothetical protein